MQDALSTAFSGGNGEQAPKRQLPPGHWESNAHRTSSAEDAACSPDVAQPASAAASRATLAIPCRASIATSRMTEDGASAPAQGTGLPAR
jgi:hypothetical protein